MQKYYGNKYDPILIKNKINKFFEKNEKKLSKIILGSAQFGMNYGISNKEGEIKTNEVFNILNFLKQKKINYIDTAFHIKK